MPASPPCRALWKLRTMSSLTSSSLLERSAEFRAMWLQKRLRRGKPLDLRFKHDGFEMPVSIVGVILRALGAGGFRGQMMANNTLQRTVTHCGPRLAAAWSSWPAAELGR